jgi:hypothetical protein
MKILGVGPDQIPIQQRQQMAGMVAANRGQDRFDLRVCEHLVNILGPVLWSIGDVAQVIAGMGRDLNLEAETFQVFHPTAKAMGEKCRRAKRRADDADRIARLQTVRSDSLT